ncbi:nitroreductase family protein, partial [Streptomyces capparidis]
MSGWSVRDARGARVRPAGAGAGSAADGTGPGAAGRAPGAGGPGAVPRPRGRGPDARLVAEALAEARSGLPVGPDTPPGPVRARWPGDGVVPPEARAGQLDLAGVLRLSVRAGVPGADGGPRTRPAASAGARYPVRVHLLAGPGCPVPPGRYAYDPLDHRLHPRGPAPPGAAPGAVAVLTVAARRTVSHYGHRAWPLLLLDAGHTAAALALAALARGHAAAVTWDAGADALAAAAGLPAPRHWSALWPGTSVEHPLAAVHLRPREGAQDNCPLAPWTALPPGGPPLPAAAVPPDPRTDRAEAVLRALTGDGNGPAPRSRPAAVPPAVPFA